MGGGYTGVNKFCDGLGPYVFLYLFLEKDKVCKILYAENIAQQVNPKLLVFAFLVAFATPLLDKFLCRPNLFCLCHGVEYIKKFCQFSDKNPRPGRG